MDNPAPGRGLGILLEEKSGTNDSGPPPVNLSGAGRRSGCLCGRCLPAAQVLRPPRKPESVDRLADGIVQAMLDGKGAPVGETPFAWDIEYHGNCLDPITVSRHSQANLVRCLVRCRQCRNCLFARRYYWGMAATAMTMASQERGLRTWFGTLTLRMDAQDDLVQRAYDRAQATPGGPRPDWDNPMCDTRFALIRNELLEDVKRYWKRLRADGARFRYFLVFERHMGKKRGRGRAYGMPHVHFLLHEMGPAPIPKRLLQRHWPFGNTNVSIVGGRSKKAAAPQDAAWYVAKYLSKSFQSRQVASNGYRPAKRVGR